MPPAAAGFARAGRLWSRSPWPVGVGAARRSRRTPVAHPGRGVGADLSSDPRGSRPVPGSIAASAEGGVWVTHPRRGRGRRHGSTLPRADVRRSHHGRGRNATGITVGQNAVWVVESGGPSVSIISPPNQRSGQDDRGRERAGGHRDRGGSRLGDQSLRWNALAHRPATVGRSRRRSRSGQTRAALRSDWEASAGWRWLARAWWCGSIRRRTR